MSEPLREMFDVMLKAERERADRLGIALRAARGWLMYGGWNAIPPSDDPALWAAEEAYRVLEAALAAESEDGGGSGDREASAPRSDGEASSPAPTPVPLCAACGGEGIVRSFEDCHRCDGSGKAGGGE